MPLQAQRHKVDSLLNLLPDEKHDTSQIRVLTSLAVEYGSRDFDSCQLFSKKILVISEKLTQQEKPGSKIWIAAALGFGKAYQMLGYSYSNTGKYLSAMIYYNKALDAWDLADKWITEEHRATLYTRKSNTLVSIGQVYLDQGDFTKALDCNLKGLKLSEASGNKRALVISYGNLGLVYRSKKDYEKALFYYNKAQVLVEQTGERGKYAAIIANAGNIYLIQKKYQLALDCFNKALAIGFELEDKEKIAVLHGNIGSVYKGLKEYDKAISYFKKGITYSEAYGEPISIGRTYGNLGTLFVEMGKYPEAEKNLNKAIEICESVGAREELETFETALSELYSRTNDHKRALTHYLRAMVISDSLFNKNNSNESARLEMNYELEKKESAILNELSRKNALAKTELEKQILLRNSLGAGVGIILLGIVLSFFFYKKHKDAQNSKRAAEFALNMTEYEMKALRAQINPHFIFNSLDAVKRYTLKSDKTNAVDYLQKFATLMRLILNNSEKEKVKLQDEITMLEYYIQLESLRFENGFDYEIKIDESIDTENEEVPSMILQPFIENAIWHGLMNKVGKGKIVVEVLREQNTLKCIIEDNGVGRDKAAEIRLSEMQLQNSKGIDITSARIELMNIKKNISNSIKIFDLHDSENQPLGTRVELLFQAA